MVILKDTVEIRASPDQITEFFLHFRDNFHAWHPDHVECRYLTSPPLREGSVIYVEEYLHGKLHKLKLHITKIEPNSRIEYKLGFVAKGGFTIEPKSTNNSLFTAEIHIGVKNPVLRSLVDRLLRTFLSSRLEGIRRHMSEEGQNLKRIMEEGSQ